MPAGRTYSDVFYVLEADGRRIGFVLNASFPTATSLHFQFTMGMDQQFCENLNKGYLPYHTGALIILDNSLHELLRYTWRQARAVELRFPALNNVSGGALLISVELAVTDVRQITPASQGNPSGYLIGARKTPAAVYLFQMLVDGLESAAWKVSKIDAFSSGQGGCGDLVLTLTPEVQANPFRDWLQSGNFVKSGKLDLVHSNLQAFFRLQFAGLRVQTIAPAFTTYSSAPATVRLSCGGVGFEAVS